MSDALFRDTTETGREDKIQAGTLGGLNTTANALNLPWEDSPEATNVDVTVGGNIVKRKGTRLLLDEVPSSSSTVFSIDQLELASGLVFVASKIGTSLSVRQVIDDALVDVTTFTNVWSSVAANQKASVITTNEAEPRLIYLTASNVPIQLHVVELSEKVTANAASYAITDNGSRYANSVEDSTLFCYKNGVRQVNTAFNYTGGVLTYTNSVVAGDVITFINFTWQWWAEAELYDVSRFYHVTTRYHVSNDDRRIAIPDTLRDDVEQDTYGLYRIYAAQGGQGNRNDSYLIRASRPNLATQYCTTNGAINDASLTHDVPPAGASFLTFGAFTANTTPSTLHLMRIRKLTLNGGRRILPANLVVQGYNFRVGTYSITQADVTATSNIASYLLFDGSAWTDPNATDVTTQTATSSLRMPTALTVAGAAAGDYITLDRGNKRGAPLDDLVRFINTERRWVGSSAVATIDSYTNANAVPAYGFGRFADYGLGTFPTVGTTFGGRIVLGGVASQPMRLLFSAVSDTEFPGALFQGFTIDAFQDPNTSAFDVSLSGTTSEAVMSLQEYQGGVFVGTSENVYRVFAREQLGPLTALTQLVGKTGALNSNAFAIGDAGLYFLGRQGIYMAVPSNGLDDSYDLQDVSFKIRDRIKQPESTCSRNFSNIQYDPQTRKLYVSVYTSESANCTANGTELYVLHTERGAWTKYETFENFRITDMTAYRDTNGARRFMIATLSPDGTSVRYIRTEWDWPTDFTRVVTNTNTGTLLPTFSETYTTVSGVQRYPHKIWTTGFNDVEDLTVTLNSVPLTFGTQWTKAGRNAIYLRETPTSELSLNITTKSPEDDDTITVRRWGATVEPIVGYTTTSTTITFIDPSNDFSNVVYTYGRNYISVFRTPVFSWGLLSNYKRAIKWAGLFSNAPSDAKFEDVLTAPATDRASMVGRAKVLTDANIAIIYNNEREGTSSYDVFRLGQLIYDISLFDTYDGPYSLDEYVQIVEPLQGTGYSIQVALWSYDRNTFEFAGYQLVAQTKGKRYSGDNR